MFAFLKALIYKGLQLALILAFFCMSFIVEERFIQIALMVIVVICSIFLFFALLSAVKKSTKFSHYAKFFIFLAIISFIGVIMWWSPLFDQMFEVIEQYAQSFGLEQTYVSFSTFYFIATIFTGLFYIVCTVYCVLRHLENKHQLKKAKQEMEESNKVE